MVAVLIDSNVLLDVMTEDARWFSWSAASIEQAADRFRLVINPGVYAEVSVRYSRIAEFKNAFFTRHQQDLVFHFDRGDDSRFTQQRIIEHRHEMISNNLAKGLVFGVNK